MILIGFLRAVRVETVCFNQTGEKRDCPEREYSRRQCELHLVILLLVGQVGSTDVQWTRRAM
jgi:hypothetical protein